MKILLVDDSTTMRNIWKKVLAGMDSVETAEAGDGVEALQAVEQNGPYDLILLDWNMPNMDGITLLKTIRGKKISTPVIMVTTEAEKPRILEALKTGANNYLVKPFTPDALKTKIDETLKKAMAKA